MSEIDQSKHNYFMSVALKQAQAAAAQNEVPVGVVITLNDEIIAKAHNQVETLKDPTAHAEMIAITQASNGLSRKWLHKCSMYVTLEPCSMCAGALVLSRIENVYYGAHDPKTGACGSILNIASHPQLNHSVHVVGGILEDQCSYEISHFFEKLRKSSDESCN